MKNLLKISGLLLLAFIITLSACKKNDDDDTTPTPDPPYFTFAKVGNIATYETSAVIPIVGTKTGTMTQTVLEKIGTNIYKVQTVMDLGLGTLGVPPSTDTSYWFISDTEMASVDDNLGTNKFMYYAKNDAVNKTYTFTDGTVTDTRVILATNESITTTLGTFPCFKIKETSSDTPSDETIYYFNNASGMVKTSLKVSTVVSGMPITIMIDMNLKSKNF